MFNSINKAPVITPSAAKSMMGQKDVVVVDVREEFEYKEGHIKDALLIPLHTIGLNKDIMPDIDKTVLVYCRSGNRSQKGAAKFKKLGYKSVYDFGGILNWPYGTVNNE